MSEGSRFEWPDDSQDATRLGPDWRWHALPRLATHDLHGVAFGFREAAEAVYDAAEQRRRPVDAIFLPLAYLWRHHLELMLKANITIWSMVNHLPPPQLGGPGGLGHDLRKLWDNFDRLSSEGADDQDLKSTRSAQRVLETFLKLEPHPDASRYPAGVDRKPYQRPERVDLQELHRAAMAVSALLGGAYDQADAWLNAAP